MRLLAVTALALLALAAAGCGETGGGTAQAEYERELQALPDLFEPVECELPDGVEALEARQAAHRAHVAALEAIEPPDEVAGAHAKLVSAERAYADALDETIEQVRAAGDPREAATRDEQAGVIAEQFALAERERPDVPELAEARRELAEQGYAVAPPPLDPDTYERRVNELVADVSPIALSDTGDIAALQAEAEAVGRELVAATQRLERVPPPRPVAEAHQHLLAGICSRGQELVMFGRFGGVEPGTPADPARLRDVIATLDPNLEEAAEEFEERGYDVAVPEVEQGA